MIKGRGAQINTHNKFSKENYVREHFEAIDIDEEDNPNKTEYLLDNPKKIVNQVKSPDLSLEYSANPYQGCEHGCIYCYARNAHEYWGFSAGKDFEQKIIVKKNAPELLKKTFQKKNWKPAPIMLSGNTDCYQPIERKMELTRKMLQVCLEYQHPVSIITKNALIMRDLDILKPLAEKDLVHVMISITSLDEKLRRKLEPRTATASQRLHVVKVLSEAGIPTGVMTAPIIPGLNDHEIPAIIKAAGEAGARRAGYTIVRLNGAIGDIFKDWLFKAMPDRAEKVWNQICSCHGGSVNDSRWGARMGGEGKIADTIKQLFRISVKKHLQNSPPFEFNTKIFKKVINNQLKLI